MTLLAQPSTTMMNSVWRLVPQGPSSEEPAFGMHWMRSAGNCVQSACRPAACAELFMQARERHLHDTGAHSQGAMQSFGRRSPLSFVERCSNILGPKHTAEPNPS